MSDLVVLDETSRTTSQDDDDLDHLFCCCSPQLGLCGANLEPADEVGYDVELEHPCVVCHDVEAITCPRCGYGISGPCACGGCGQR